MKEKNLAKNAIFNVVYKIFNIIFPLVTAAYISRILLAVGVGKFNIAQNIVQYFVLVAPLGLINHGTREIARQKGNRKGQLETFSSLFLINLISTALCTVAYYSIIFSVPYFASERLLFSAVGIQLILNVLNVEWFFQGNEDYVYISIRNIVVKLIAMILMFVFVKKSSDYVIYALIYSFGITGNYLLNILKAFKRGVRLSFKGIRIIEHLRPLFVLLASTIAIELYTLVDTTMLGAICGDEIVGYYSNAAKLDRIIIGLIAAIGAVLLPRLSFYRENGMVDETNKLISSIVMMITFLALPCFVGVLFLARPLVLTLFGQAFEPSILTVRIGSGLFLTLAYSNLFGTQVLLSNGQETKLLFCTLVGAGINISLNLFLIRFYQQNGAIIASVISEFTVCLLSYLFARKYVSLEIRPIFFVKTFISLFLLFFSLVICAFFGLIDILEILVFTSVGAFVYLGSSILLKNEAVLIFLKSIKKEN